MASYRRTQEQREQFETIVLAAVRMNHSLVDDLREVVKRRLIETGMPWAKALAREATFNTSLRSALMRLRDDGKVRCHKYGHKSEWLPASS